MTDRRVLLVANEAPWPQTSGGRLRIAAFAEHLGELGRVTVAYPAGNDGLPVAEAPAAIELEPVVPDSRAVWLGTITKQPRIGVRLFGLAGARRIRELVRRLEPDVVVLSHSYLSAIVDGTHAFTVVDFPNVEFRRLASVRQLARGRHRLSATIESVKALGWEPELARKAHVVTATTPRDVDLLRDCGALVALEVPNAVAGEPGARTPSPPAGPVTFVASAGYPPNDRAAERLIREIWPRLRDRTAGAQLRVLGRGTERYAGLATDESIDVVGTVPDVRPYLREASVVVAPVDGGGGTQLKILEALSSGRVVVASPYSFDSVPSAARAGCIVGRTNDEFAQHAADLFRDVEQRHLLERRLSDRFEAQTWGEALRPLVDHLDAALGGRRRGA